MPMSDAVLKKLKPLPKQTSRQCRTQSFDWIAINRLH
jgi:hypothetical protein